MPRKANPLPPRPVNSCASRFTISAPVITAPARRSRRSRSVSPRPGAPASNCPPPKKAARLPRCGKKPSKTTPARNRKPAPHRNVRRRRARLCKARGVPPPRLPRCPDRLAPPPPAADRKRAQPPREKQLKPGNAKGSRSRCPALSPSSYTVKPRRALYIRLESDVSRLFPLRRPAPRDDRPACEPIR